MDAAFLALRPHHCKLRKGRVGDPHLGPVENDVVAIFLVRRGHASWVGSVVGFGQSKASHPLAGCEFGQELLLLLLRTVLPNGVHDKGALHRRRGTQAAVTALELLHNQAVGNLIEAGASVLLWDVGTKCPNLTQPRQQVLGEFAALRGVFDDGADFLLHPRTRGIADQLVLLGEELIHVVVILALIEVCTHGP